MTNARSPLRRFTLVLLLLLLSANIASAQFRAGIQGTVTDPSGAPLPGAIVVVKSQETNVSREATTSEAGFYRVSSLPPGVYTVTVSLAGFKDRVVQDVRVSAEQVRGLDLTIELGGVEETVTVTAVGALQTENAEISGTLTTVEIQKLPQANRDPYELVRLTPGVFGLGARDAGGNSISFPNSSGPGGSNSLFDTENGVPVSANGQRITANSFQIDGVNVNSQAWGGRAIITPNQESVKEIRVLASTYSAENGRNSGAMVQVVSQNGTNEFHGSAVFKRNTPGLNAYQKWGGPHGEAPRRVDKRLSQFGGSLGGPIVKDKLFFFLSYEGVRQTRDTIAAAWVETPQFVDLVRSRRPNSIAARIFGVPDMTPPRVVNVLPRNCASLGLPDPRQCATLPGGLDIGSPAGALGQLVSDPTGGGLDGIPDIQFAEIRFPEKSNAQQFNARIDYQLTKDDLVAFSMYFVPVTNEFNASWAGQGRPVLDFTSAR